MTAQLAPVPVFRSWDNNGFPLVGGKLYTYQAGTTTPQATYIDSTQTTQNTNPVILNFRGEAFVWLDPALTYKFVLRDFFGNLIWTEDNIPGGFGALPISTSLIPTPTNTFTLGNSTHSWANVYVGPNAAPVLDTVSGNIGYYARTAAEIAASVTPTNFSYPPGDMRRYGVDLTGATDSTSAMQNCINSSAGAFVYLPNGIYKFTSVTGIENMRMTGQSRGGVVLNSSTSGIALDCFGLDNLWIEHFTMNCSNPAATGVRFGNGCQHIGWQDLAITGAGGVSNTGIGMLLDAANPGAFSGNLGANLAYILGFKFGIKCTGHDVAVNTWTSMTFINCYVIGNSASIISGSIGLWMDAMTNGVGSAFLGGSIEGFDVGLKVDTGGYGLDFRGDLEGNNTLFTVGTTFAGSVKEFNSIGSLYEAATNAAVNRWYVRSQLNGVLIDEAWFEHDIVLYDSGGFAPVSIYRGASLANGGTPTLKFQFATGNSSGDNGANRNYLQFPTGNRIFAGVGTPENVVTAPVGSLYMRSDGGALTSLYVKETGTGNTGWIGK